IRDLYVTGVQTCALPILRAANAVLASARGKGACWSSYSASHSTFEMLIGEPYAEDNIVLSMPACASLAGPVRWPAQQIEVVWKRSEERRVGKEGRGRRWR